MRILGIDPGTRIVGFGVVDFKGNRITPVAYGAINVIKEKDYTLRLKLIYDQLTEVIDKYKPEQAAIEEVFFGKNVKSAIKIGEGRGVAILCAANAGLPVYPYDAKVIKKAVVGTGSAQKAQVQFMVQKILGLEEIPKPEDAADALAIAVCHCNRIQFSNLLKK